MEFSSVIESNGTGANETRRLLDFFSIAHSFSMQTTVDQTSALTKRETTKYRGYRDQ